MVLQIFSNGDGRGTPSCWKIICCYICIGTRPQEGQVAHVRENVDTFPSQDMRTNKATSVENFLWLRVFLNTTHGFSSGHVCSLWVLNTPSRVNVLSSAQRPRVWTTRWPRNGAIFSDTRCFKCSWQVLSNGDGRLGRHSILLEDHLLIHLHWHVRKKGR